MSAVIRKAVLADAEKIFAVEKDSFSVPWSMDSICRDLQNTKLTRYFVLEKENGDIIGYAGYWFVADEGQITNIALCKAYRRQGYGEKLVRAMMDTAFAEGCSNIFLEVRVSNIPALQLYHKLGYTVLSVRKEYYSEPVEDAYIMKCRSIEYIKDDM